MAKYFQITIPEGASKANLDSQGRATVQYTVKNVSSAPIDGRAVLTCPPAGSPPASPHKDWIRIDGAADRHFDKDKEEVFNVRICVPAKSLAGDYAFRLDMATVAKPDEGDKGQAVAFSVAPSNKGNGFPWWIMVAAVVVLAVLGVGAWLLLRNKGITIPDLTGKSTADAITALTAVNLKLDPNVNTAQSTAAESGKIVNQNPAAGSKAAAESAVQVTVGAQYYQVPSLVGLAFKDAQTSLTNGHLAVGQSTTEANGNFAGGVVWKQSPDANAPALGGTAVNVWLTPQTATVPRVVGMNILDAKRALEAAGLALGNVTGNQAQDAVTAQDPDVNKIVQVGTKVNVTVPCSGVGCSQVLRYDLYLVQPLDRNPLYRVH